MDTVTTFMLLLVAFYFTPLAKESTCGLDTSAVSIEHARYLYDMQDYTCALEELVVVVSDTDLLARAKCEALLLKSAILYDSLFFADTKELREMVLTPGIAAFRAYPDWNEKYDNSDKGFEILMIEARQAAPNSPDSEQYSLVIHVKPKQSIVFLDSSLWASQVAKIIKPGSHEIVVSHKSYCRVVDTVVANSDTTVYYDLPAMTKARTDSIRLDSIARPDKQMRIGVPNIPGRAKVILRLGDKSQKQKCCDSSAVFVVKPMSLPTVFRVSFFDHGRDITAKIDSVVFFHRTIELRYKIHGSAAIIDFGRPEWLNLSTIDAIVYLDPSSL